MTFLFHTQFNIVLAGFWNSRVDIEKYFELYSLATMPPPPPLSLGQVLRGRLRRYTISKKIRDVVWLARFVDSAFKSNPCCG